MQSSPPTRAHERPTSPTNSQYSIDLDALEPGSHSGASTPLPAPHVDRVLSEDIDGPSDFTQNLEAWMIGGTIKKRGTLRSLKEEDARERSPSPPKEAVSTDEETAVSHHTPTNSPPKESVFEDRLRVEDGEADSSDWDPYAEGQHTPLPPSRQFLQPTVEDYHSEFTPARLPSTQAHQSLLRNGRTTSPVQHSPRQDSEAGSCGRPSSPTVSPERSPVFQRSAPRHFSSQTDEATHEQQLEALYAKCQQLEDLNSALHQAVDEERRMRRENNAAHEAAVADAARRERDLTEMKDNAHRHKEDFRREFGDLNARLQQHEKQAETSRLEMEKLKRQHAAETNELKEQLEREKAEHNQEIRALEQDVELARRSRDDAEESARVHREELEEVQDAHDVETDRFELELKKAEDLKGQFAELNEQLRSANAAKDGNQVAKKAAEDTTSGLRAELSLLKQKKDEEMTRITTDHVRAVGLAEGLHTQLEDLQRQLKDAQTAHDAEVERLQSSNQNTPDEDLQTRLNDALLDRDAAQDELAALKENTGAQPQPSDDLQTQLNSAILERDAAQDTIQTLQAELDALKLELTDLEAVNNAFDNRVSDAIRKRESYWRGRLKDVEEERKIMAKALLRQWGREEVGTEVEGMQGYEYLFPRKGKA